MIGVDIVAVNNDPYLGIPDELKDDIPEVGALHAEPLRLDPSESVPLAERLVFEVKDAAISVYLNDEGRQMVGWEFGSDFAAVFREWGAARARVGRALMKFV